MGAVESKALDGGQKGGRFDNDFVAGRDHGLADQVQRLLAAGGHDQSFGRYGGTFARHEVADLLTQRAPAFGGTVLQHRAGVVG